MKFEQTTVNLQKKGAPVENETRSTLFIIPNCFQSVGPKWL